MEAHAPDSAAEGARSAGDLAVYEAERSAVLRKRLTAFCSVLLGFVAISTLANLFDLRDPIAAARRAATVDLAGDALLALIFGAGLAWTRLGKPDLRGVMRVLTVLIAASGVVIALTEPVVESVHRQMLIAGQTDEAPIVPIGTAGLFGFLIVHFLGSTVMALSARESIALLLPAWAAFAAGMLGLVDEPLLLRAAKVAVFPLAVLPGVIVSWLRYRRFKERFWARTVSDRYGEISRELSYARRVHEALFPPPVDDGPVLVTYQYEPMREVGGDFLFIQRSARGANGTHRDAVDIVLVDVSGHGVAAALTVSRLHDELRRAAQSDGGAMPGNLITALNRFVSEFLAPQAVFATAIALSLDATLRELRYASAGHPAGFLRHAGGALEELRSTAPMLGAVPADLFDAGERRLPLTCGDRVVAFTDGAPEAVDHRGEQFGVAAIRRVLEGCQPTHGDSAKALHDEVMRYCERRVRDDMLIVEATVVARSSPACVA